MNRRVWVVTSLGAVLVIVTVALVQLSRVEGSRERPRLTPDEEARFALYDALAPVKLSNCVLERFGEKNDGGYLLCGNLLGDVTSGYSYGISGYDGWGCDISRRLGVAVHQYDCFDLTRPVCEGGSTIFHGECIGTEAGFQEGRPFDTLAGQIAKNGDAGKSLIVKMDVEGVEWDTFLTAPDEILHRIDQLVVELHGYRSPRHLEAIERLKRFFYVAHLHWNNYSCVQGQAPFRAWAYEVLFVNKRLAVVEPGGRVSLPHPLDAPNDPNAYDCQGFRRERRLP